MARFKLRNEGWAENWHPRSTSLLPDERCLEVTHFPEDGIGNPHGKPCCGRMEGSPVSLDPSLDSHRDSSGDGPGDNPTFMPSEGKPSMQRFRPFRPLLFSEPWSSCHVGYSDVTTLHFFFKTTQLGNALGLLHRSWRGCPCGWGSAVFQIRDCVRPVASPSCSSPLPALPRTHLAPAEFSWSRVGTDGEKGLHTGWCWGRRKEPLLSWGCDSNFLSAVSAPGSSADITQSSGREAAPSLGPHSLALPAHLAA